MIFDLKGKVAIITGGASGIGWHCAKELLRNGAKGITIADLNEPLGCKAVEELSAEFGKAKCCFAITDVSDYESFRNAFTLTLQAFGNIDILINSAGICNDAIWQKEVAVNVNGTIQGILLGMEEFILKHKSGAEGVIINVSSIRGVQPSGDRPIYAATKFAIHGMSLAWGSQEHYERTGIKVIAVCPGSTSTPLIANPQNTNLGPAYEEIRKNNAASIKLPRQTSEECANCIMDILKQAETGTVWVVEGSQKRQYIMPDRFSMKVSI